MWLRCKSWCNEHKRDIVLFALFALISTLSFGIGYLSAREFTKAPIVIETCPE